MNFQFELDNFSLKTQKNHYDLYKWKSLFLHVKTYFNKESENCQWVVVSESRLLALEHEMNLEKNINTDYKLCIEILSTPIKSLPLLVI